MINRFIRKKISLIILMFFFSTLLTSCIVISTPAPDIEVIKASNQYNTALYANDEGSNGFFVKRKKDGIIGCYLVSWNDETRKIDTSTMSHEEIVFDIEDEHLKEAEITDFELLNVYIDTYYYVYFMANEKIYEYVLDYTNDSLFLMPLHFSYINFREVTPLVDGFNNVVNARYNSIIIEKEEENILEEISNESIINVFGMNYLYLNEDKHLVYQNISKNKPVTHIFIEKEINVIHSIMNNNYAIVLTDENKLYKLNYNDLTIKEVEVVSPEYIVSTINNNYFAVVDQGIIKVYNYMLDLVGEITPIEPTSNIVGLCLSFEGAAKYKKLVLTTAYLNGNVLYSTVDEIKLS